MVKVSCKAFLPKLSFRGKCPVLFFLIRKTVSLRYKGRGDVCMGITRVVPREVLVPVFGIEAFFVGKLLKNINSLTGGI